MINFINKIKQFFKNIISKNKIKKLDAPKENDLSNSSSSINKSIIENKKIEKNKFFEIYNSVKKGQYNINELSEEEAKKIIAILNSEISLKRDKLNNDITELNILKIDNRINEKNRILELYNNVKNQKIDLVNIERDDLLKIRKLLLEEVKIQDERFEDEIKSLEMLKSVS